MSRSGLWLHVTMTTSLHQAALLSLTICGFLSHLHVFIILSSFYSHALLFQIAKCKYFRPRGEKFARLGRLVARNSETLPGLSAGRSRGTLTCMADTSNFISPNICWKHSKRKKGFAALFLMWSWCRFECQTEWQKRWKLCDSRSKWHPVT